MCVLLRPPTSPEGGFYQDRAMIIFKKKPETTIPKPAPSAPVVGAQPTAEETGVARHTKPDSDGKRRRKRQTSDDNRLL